MARSASHPAPPGRRRAVAWGIILGYSNVALAITRNILLVPAYLHYMTLAEYGAWLATGATGLQWLITDFGLAGVLMQQCAALHGAGKSARLGTTISSGLLAGVALALVLSLVAAVAIPLIPMIGGLTPAQSAEIRHCLYLAVAAGALGIVAAIAQGLVRSLQHAAAAGSITLVAEISGIVVTLLCLWQGVGLSALAYGLLMRSATAVVGQAGYLLTRTGSFRLAQAPALRVMRELFVDGWTSFISSLAMKTPTQANTLLIGYTLGPTSAALYGLTVRAHEAALLFLAQVNGSLAPSMAHLWGSGNADRFRELVTRIAMIGALAGGVCMAVIIAVNADFVTLWLHDRGFAGQTTSILMAVMIWVSAAGSVAYDSLYALGRFRLIAITFVVTAIAHVAILVGLLPHGLWGAALATLISTLLWSAIFWWQLRHAIQLQPEQLKRMLRDFLATGASGAAVAAALLVLVPRVESWPGVISVAVTCAVAVTAIILLLNPHIRAICRFEVAVTARTLFARRRTPV